MQMDSIFTEECILIQWDHNKANFQNIHLMRIMIIIVIMTASIVVSSVGSVIIKILQSTRNVLSFMPITKAKPKTDTVTDVSNACNGSSMDSRSEYGSTVSAGIDAAAIGADDGEVGAGALEAGAMSYWADVTNGSGAGAGQGHGENCETLQHRIYHWVYKSDNVLLTSCGLIYREKATTSERNVGKFNK